MKRLVLVALILGAGALVYLAAVEVAFRMLGNRPTIDEPGGGWES